MTITGDYNDGGGAVFAYRNDGTVSVSFDGRDDNAGTVRVRNEAGDTAVTLDGNAGDGAALIAVDNASGFTRVTLDGGDPSGGGTITLQAGDSSSTVFLDGDSGDAGAIEVRNNLSQTRVLLDGEDDNAGGRIEVRGEDGATVVRLRGEEFLAGDSGAVIEMDAEDGTETIEIDSGNVTGNASLFVDGTINGDTKSAVVKLDNGEERLLYCTESPEIWFEDVGSGQLHNGFAEIVLDPEYRQTVAIDASHPMRVMVTLTDDCRGVYVKKLGDRFQVRELQGGRSNATFDYKIICKRRGAKYQDVRLPKFERPGVGKDRGVQEQSWPGRKEDPGEPTHVQTPQEGSNQP